VEKIPKLARWILTVFIAAPVVLYSVGCSQPADSTEPITVQPEETPTIRLVAPSTDDQPPAVEPSENLPVVEPTATYDPGAAGPILEAGNRNYETGNYINAINDYSLAILEDPNYADAYYNRGLAYHAFNNPTAAIDDFTRAIELDPYRPDVFVARAKVYQQLDNIEAALDDLSMAEEIDSTYPPIFLTRGRLFSETLGPSDNYESALVEFQKVVELQPDRPDGYIERGKTYAALGRTDLALVDLNVAITLAPINAEAHYVRGLIYSSEGKHLDALEDYEIAEDAGIRTLALFLNLGTSYTEAEEYQDAVRVLDEALGISPNNAEVHYQKGLAQFYSNQNSAALFSANRALQIDSAYVDAYALRATVHLNLQRWQDAIVDYRHAYQLDPDYYDAFYGIAQAQQALGQEEAAIVSLERYLDEAPPSAANYVAAAAFLELIRQSNQTATPQLTASPTP